MREPLGLERGLDGRIWRHVSRGDNLFMHCHEELEINLATRGRAAYLVKDHRYDLIPGTLLWLFPDQEHLLIEQSSDFQMWIVIFRRGLVTRICTGDTDRVLHQRDPQGSFCTQLDHGRLQDTLQHLAEHASEPSVLNAGLAYVLLAAWSVHQQAAHRTPVRQVHAGVEQAARRLHQTPGCYDLPSLGRAVGLSPSRLSRLFHRQMGIKLVAYRQRRCLERFLDLFARYPQRGLLPLALEAGFGSYPQFHRVFRQLLGRTPADFLRHPD